ncbi:ATP-binding cassette domain-containing protein [Verrucosispora sp. WMMA2044]|uniref:ATP-binding cassette domain-containing protein n=1 Tax=Verrucosispora sioxanthis TaxID=2499994 RepID=A0A6M1L907_9ACTN|nr:MULTISPECIES: ATP-binding cassette domain-containing protein [Micromonospora]NEE65569.1 ATP-binding cassette domain-containing protein [Verrucosispora sioxanthis]NGM14679.1 ATP-binding cassette domain-containing protein [Verrucosispora sioxanthis]WBB48828.1 ATP-binding cassette domain-containing protein [Verrucosispora sp. WMMA2044]
MPAVLEIEGLRKTYRSRRRGTRNALDGFDMRVEAGQVHGFLGPNGSGKTTTLRTLLGLIRPDGGRMAILGHEVPDRLDQVAPQVGAIVESPQFFPHFTARDTLSLLAGAGDLPEQRVDEVLELVGLRDRAGERVKTYSLGMKQRLAVASALLKNPRLLILDEPANGLDPGGIREMRTLMRNLSEAGMTVVLSSHILGEIQLICDSVTIISLGRRVAFGPVDEVLAQHSSGAVRVRLEAVTDLPVAATALTRAGVRVTANDDHLMLAGVDKPATVTRILAEQGLYVSELAPIAVDLESVFLELTATAPVPGQHRQVDQSVRVDGTAPSAPAGGGWGA